MCQDGNVKLNWWATTEQQHVSNSNKDEVYSVIRCAMNTPWHKEMGISERFINCFNCLLNEASEMFILLK